MAGGCCGGNAVAPSDDRFDCIVLGLEGSGKTLIVRRLQCIRDRAKAKSFQSSTWPTTGVEIANVPTGSDGKLRHARTRELGGCMSAIWPNYYDDADSLVYVVDLAAPDAWSTAALQLQSILLHPDMQDKPCVVVLNKSDMAPVKPTTLVEMEKTLDWQTLQDTCKAGLEMMAVSALTGHNADGLLQWLVRTKAAGMAGTHKARVCTLS